MDSSFKSSLERDVRNGTVSYTQYKKNYNGKLSKKEIGLQNLTKKNTKNVKKYKLKNKKI